MARLLLLSCSRVKVSTGQSLPAIERYDGPAFRVVRRFLREVHNATQDVMIYILSAKYGLISGSTAIDVYDERMTSKRADELREETLLRLRQAVAQYRPRELFISLGHDYLRAVGGYQAELPHDLDIIVSRSPSGKKLTELRNWLYGHRGTGLSTQPREWNKGQLELPLVSRRPVRLRGCTVALSREEVLQLARQALLFDQSNSKRFQSWYVLIDDRKVSPKWLASKLTGLPVSAFAADEARRMLQALGIEVYQIDD